MVRERVVCRRYRGRGVAIELPPRPPSPADPQRLTPIRRRRRLLLHTYGAASRTNHYTKAVGKRRGD